MLCGVAKCVMMLHVLIINNSYLHNPLSDKYIKNDIKAGQTKEMYVLPSDRHSIEDDFMEFKNKFSALKLFLDEAYYCNRTRIVYTTYFRYFTSTH